MPDQELETTIPTIPYALAFPGCAFGAFACLGMLDELDAQGLRPHMIACMSSTSIVATAFAAGKTKELRDRARTIVDKGEIKSWFRFSFRAGLFSMEPATKMMREIYGVETLEELSIPLSIVTSDLVSGTEVRFTKGSLPKAIMASCAYPGLLEPVIENGQVLVDGGVFSVIPIDAAYALGAKKVIGVEMYNEPHIFVPTLLKLKGFLNRFKRNIGKRIGSIAAFREEQKSHRRFGFFRVLGASIDYAAQALEQGDDYDCDLLIDFDRKRIKSRELNHIDMLYEQGRQTIRNALPAILETLRDASQVDRANKSAGRASAHPAYGTMTIQESIAENQT